MNPRKPVVSNASVLINLARIGHLGLLQHLYGELTVPEAVWHIEAKHKGLLQAIRPHLDALRDIAGFRISERLYWRVLQDEHEA